MITRAAPLAILHACVHIVHEYSASALDAAAYCSAFGFRINFAPIAAVQEKSKIVFRSRNSKQNKSLFNLFHVDGNVGGPLMQHTGVRLDTLLFSSCQKWRKIINDTFRSVKCFCYNFIVIVLMYITQQWFSIEIEFRVRLSLIQSWGWREILVKFRVSFLSLPRFWTFF